MAAERRLRFPALLCFLFATACTHAPPVVNPELRAATQGGDALEISDALGVRNECTPTFYERFSDAFLNEAQAFVNVVREDRPPPLTLRDATEATRIGIAVTESLRTKRSVEL